MASFTVNVSDGSAASDSGTADPNETVQISCFGGGRPIAIISGPAPDSYTQATGTGAQTGDIAHGTTATWNTSLSSNLDGNGNGGATVITFARRLTTGGTTQQQTVTVTTNSVTISLGSLGPDPSPEGGSVSVSWSSNFSGTLYYNSTSNRFTTQSGVLGSGGAGTLNLTAATVTAPDGDWNAQVTARYGSTSGSTKDTSNSIVLYKPVALGTTSLAETSRDDTDGSFILQASVSGAETINGLYPIEYQFRRKDTLAVIQAFSTTSSYAGTGDLRGVGIQVQHRINGAYNSTGGSSYQPGGAGGTGLIIPQIAPDATFTASNDSILSTATTFQTTIAGATGGEEVRIIKFGTGEIFENPVTITNATSQVITANNTSVNTTNIPQGATTQCRVQVRRPTSLGGDNGWDNGPTFDVTRNAAPDGVITVDLTDPNGTNINSTGVYNSADGTFPNNGQVTATISGGNSSTEYRMITTTGSTSNSGSVIINTVFGTRTGNGAITISTAVGGQGSNVQGDQVSYRVQYKEVGAGASTWLNATGTRVTFTLTHEVETPLTPIVFNNGAEASSATITVQEANSNSPPNVDCDVQFNQSGGTFTTATGTPLRVTGYTQNRGTTLTYRSRFRNRYTGVTSSTASNAYFLVYLNPAPDTSITVTPTSYTLNSILAGETSDKTFSYTGGGSTSEYRMESVSVTGTVDTDSGTSGSFVCDYSNNELPPDGSTYTYTFEGRRAAAFGGDPSAAYQAVAGGTSSVSVQRLNLTAADRNITVNGFSPASPATSSAFSDTLSGNTFISSGQTTETIAIADAQVGDSIRVIKDTNGAILVAFFEITSTSFDIVVPTSLAEFPGGQSELVKVQIKRTNANNGDNNNATALAFTLTRNLNQATGRLLIDLASSDITFQQTTNIGATAYIAAADGSTGSDTSMDIDLSGTVSGEDYRVVVTSGTPNNGNTTFTETTATGTTLSYFLSEGRLPNVNSTVSYKIQARDNSATGDGVWYDCFHDLLGTGTYVPGNDAVFTITRDDYVAPDTTVTVTSSMVLTGLQYEMASGSTSESFSWSGGSANTSYSLTERDPSTGFPAGPSGSFIGETTGASGTFNVASSDFPTYGFPVAPNGDRIWSFDARVLKVNNGESLRQTIQTYDITREYINSPTISGLTVRADSGDASKIVPCAEFSAYGGGTGELQYAFSTTAANPTNWTSTGFTNLVTTSRFNGPSTARSATALYIGIRQISNLAGITTSTPVYTSDTSGPYYLDPDTTQTISSITYPGGGVVYSAGDTIAIANLDTSSNATLVVNIPNREVTQSEITPLSIGSTGLGTLSSTTSYVVNTTSGTIPNGGPGELVGSIATPATSTSDFTISNSQGELPIAGSNVNYRVRSFLFTARGGTSSGANDSANYFDPDSIANNEFNMERAGPFELGGPITGAPLQQDTQSGVVGITASTGATATLTVQSGTGVCKLVKNNGTPVLAASTPIAVANGDELWVVITTPNAYSSTTTVLLEVKDSGGTVIDSDTFSVTTQTSQTGTGGGGGGTGNYGLEVRDSNNKVILTNSDKTADFCYATSITIGAGSSTATGPAVAANKGGNTVIVLTDLNPFVAAGRVQTALINSGKQVQLTILDNQNLPAAKTYEVVVFNFTQ